MPGKFSPPPRVSDPGMHHGTCVTHVPWCMPGSLINDFPWSRRRGKTFPAFPVHAQTAILRIWQEAHWAKMPVKCMDVWIYLTQNPDVNSGEILVQLLYAFHLPNHAKMRKSTDYSSRKEWLPMVFLVIMRLRRITKLFSKHYNDPW